MTNRDQIGNGIFSVSSWGAEDPEEYGDKGPFGIESMRWTKGAGRRAAHRTAINRDLNDYEPILLRFGPEAYEVKPNQLYLELEQLSLDDASDDALRAYAGFRAQVIDDILLAAWDDIHEAAQDE